MNENNEDLIVQGVEETPLSQGQKVTELQVQVINMRSLKYQKIIGYTLAGVLALGGLAVSFATKDPTFALGGMFASSIPGMLGANAGKWLVYNQMLANAPTQQSPEETKGGIDK